MFWEYSPSSEKHCLCLVESKESSSVEEEELKIKMDDRVDFFFFGGGG